MKSNFKDTKLFKYLGFWKKTGVNRRCLALVIDKKYYPEIDGLRAVAVLAVILFHLNLSFIPGGFLGVDIFFVISGFLITKKILNRLKFGNFTFKDFYISRIKRLFPALFFVILITFVLGVIFLSPKDFSNLGIASTFSILPLSNLIYWLQAGYFDSSSMTKPLLHMWSLGVEEQFYIFWPLILVFLFKFIKNKKNIFFVFLGLSFASFLGSYFGHLWDPSGVFYLMPFRIFEFCIGAIGVWLASRVRLINWKKELIFLLGIILVITPMLAKGRDFDSFSTVLALCSCLGALIIIVIGHTRVFGLILRNGVSVFWGKISYSLYLVHWPIVVYYQYRGSVLPSYLGSGIVIMLSFILASILYYYVEIPCWKKDLLNKKVFNLKLSTIILIIVLVFIPVSLNTKNTKIWKWRSSQDLQEILKSNENIFIKDIFRTGDCMLTRNNSISDLKPYCYKSDPNRKNIILFGSSQAADLQYGFRKELGDTWDIYQVTGAGCGKINRNSNGDICQKISSLFFDEILKNNKFDLVVISGLHALPEIDEYKKRLEKIGVNYVFIGPRPEYNISVEQALYGYGSIDGFDEILQNHVIHRVYNKENDLNNYFDQSEVFCNLSKFCAWKFNNSLLYIDGKHLSFVGSEFVAKAFSNWLRNK